MADQQTPTVVQVRQILQGIKRSSALWAEVRVLTRSHPAMNTEIFQDVSDSFEATLRDGENAIKEFMDVPRDQGAFKQGDNISYAALQNVVESQKTLTTNLDDIKRQLQRAYNDQFNPGRQSSKTPESVLDIGNIMSMRDAAQEYINSTSRALVDLARRIDVREVPPSRTPPRPQQYQRAPESPMDQRGYRSSPIVEQERPGVPTRPPPQPRRPLRQDPPPPPTPPPQPIPMPIDPPSTHTPTPDAKRIPNPTPVAMVSTSPGSYCTGALRLQRDPTLTIRDIMRESAAPSNLLICKHCNLELGDQEFREAVFGGQKKGTMIAKQHMLACASIWDRKAMFKCLTCSSEDMDAEFRDIEDFKAHLKAH